MKTLLLLIVAITSFSTYAEMLCTDPPTLTPSGEPVLFGVYFCADVDEQSDRVILTKPVLVHDPFVIDDGSILMFYALSPSWLSKDRKKVCKAFSKKLLRNLEYKRNSIVVGYSTSRIIYSRDEIKDTVDGKYDSPVVKVMECGSF